MNTPIDAVAVPVAPVVRPEFWAVAYTFKGSSGEMWSYPFTCATEEAAREFAADKANAILFRLPGSAAND